MRVYLRLLQCGVRYVSDAILNRIFSHTFSCSLQNITQHPLNKQSIYRRRMQAHFACGNSRTPSFPNFVANTIILYPSNHLHSILLHFKRALNPESSCILAVVAAAFLLASVRPHHSVPFTHIVHTHTNTHIHM